MLFNSTDTWPQTGGQTTASQQQQQQKQQQQQTSSNKPSLKRQTTALNPTSSPSMPTMSPNDIYGVLLQYHLQQQQQQQQQQQFMNPHDLFMASPQQLRSDDPAKNSTMSQLHQYQLMKRAAQVAAAQHLMSKASSTHPDLANFVPQGQLQQQQQQQQPPKYGLNSPASSTTSSNDSTSSPFNSIEDLLNLEEISRSNNNNNNNNNSGQRQRDELLRTIATAATIASATPHTKRPYLKFSMDAILGTGAERGAKRFCQGLLNSVESETNTSDALTSQRSLTDEANIQHQNLHQQQQQQQQQMYNRIQLNYSSFMGGGGSSGSSSQRPSPTASSGNELLLSEQSKMSQQHQLAMAAAAVASKNGQASFNPLSMGKCLYVRFFFLLCVCVCVCVLKWK